LFRRVFVSERIVDRKAWVARYPWVFRICAAGYRDGSLKARNYHGLWSAFVWLNDDVCTAYPGIKVGLALSKWDEEKKSDAMGGSLGDTTRIDSSN
jgi:hypothetical protein